jgi:CubicO group peptidase (beta-lactamase class C family)
MAKGSSMLAEGKLDSVSREIMSRWRVPGLSVGIVDRRKIIFTRGYGVQSLETRIPVTPDSLFCLASVSKVFVATAVMQLVERGKMDLDASLIQYLPTAIMADDRHRQITIRQILSHTSGMPDEDEFAYNDLWANPEYDEGASERYMGGLQTRKMVADPGRQFKYSNIAYNLLGAVIAKVTGTPFEHYMKEHVLIPAGMARSTFLMDEVDPAHLAVPHLRTPEMTVSPVYPYHRADAPASALHASAQNMCHWAMACLNLGSFQGAQLLQPAGFDLMLRSVVKRGFPPLYEDMALGWNLGHYHGTRTASHGGFGAGLSSSLIILPEAGRAVVVMCNDESSAILSIRQAVLDVMLGREPQTCPVSWMIPISQALAEGGLEAACVFLGELEASDQDHYAVEEDDLMTLAMHLLIAGNADLAVGVLGLNLHAFPGSAGSYYYLAQAYSRKGSLQRAEECAVKALELNPGDTAAAEFLDRLRARQP